MIYQKPRNEEEKKKFHRLAYEEEKEGLIDFFHKQNYKDLTEEERLRMIEADIPKFKVVGEVELTEEKKREGKEILLSFIKERGKK